MNRRALLRVVLSIVLLLSQQMAIAHAISHWSGSARLVQDEGSRLSKAVATDQSCEQCLAFAQIASALGNAPRTFAATDVASIGVAMWAVSADCARPACPFQSRAPPAAK
ncbi:MAG: hypothetical protein V4463_13100 [Pseudomonadota bacterium]